MKKKDKIYFYEYPHDKKRLFEKLPHGFSTFGDIYVQKENDDMFFVGVEKTGHSDGMWYVAKTEEVEGKTIVHGKFVYSPDNSGNPKAKEMTKFTDILMHIVLFPLIILAAIISFVDLIYRFITKKPNKNKIMEMRLDNFMMQNLGCKKGVPPKSALDKRFDFLDEQINEYSRIEEGNAKQKYDKFNEIYAYLLQLDEKENLSVEGKKPLKYLQSIINDEGKNYFYKMKFSPAWDNDRKYEIGVCVKGDPLIKKL